MCGIKNLLPRTRTAVRGGVGGKRKVSGDEDSLTRIFFASPYRSRRRASGERRPLPSTRAFAPRSSASEASPLTPAEQRRRKRQKAHLSSSFPSPAEGFASLLLSVAKRTRTLHFIDARRLPDSTVAFLVRYNSAHRCASQLLVSIGLVVHFGRMHIHTHTSVGNFR